MARNTRNRSKHTLYALLAAGALAVSACGNDSGTGPDPDPDPDPGPAYQTIETWAGTGTPGLGSDGLAPTSTDLYLPQDLTWNVNGDNKPYIVDWNNHRIRTVTGGAVATVVGTGELGDAQAGPALASKLNHPTHVSFDPQGRLVMSAWHNSKIMRMDFGTGNLELICGDGQRSFGGDGGPMAGGILDLPTCTEFDSQGRMYITDQANVRIRRVDLTGMIDTYCGNGVAGYSGDGGLAGDAQISLPKGQAAYPFGRIRIKDDMLYLCDTENSCIRRIDLTTNIITTVAGTGVAGHSGDGGLATDAQLSYPTDVDVAADGTIYIADTFNSCVRKVDTDGMITTFAGTPPASPGDTGNAGFAGDGGAPTAAKLNRPFGLAFDGDENLYVADTFNHRIRVIKKYAP